MTKNEVYKLIQTFLKDPPVIIWGSGATIGYGLPSMDSLNEILKSKHSFFNKTNTNLEEELGKSKYEKHLPKIRKTIWEAIEEKDKIVLENMLHKPETFKGIKCLVEKFLDSHPNMLNIITTNYDRVLENVLSLNNIAFTDGFSGRNLSLFDEDSFLFSKVPKNLHSFVNIIKVHGSLNWFNINGDIRYYPTLSDEPEIIPPGKNKYRQAYSEPYRNLIQIADKIIKNSKSLLVVGFGFNDEHLTPRVTEQIRKGVPIIILTKNITGSTKKQLEGASCYLGMEEAAANKTRILIKQKKNDTESIEEIDGSLWQLNNFMEVFYNE